jgi:hypothetical protein
MAVQTWMSASFNWDQDFQIFRTTRDLQDVFAPPKGKVCFLWLAAYLGAKMCLEHLPDER